MLYLLGGPLLMLHEAAFIISGHEGHYAHCCSVRLCGFVVVQETRQPLALPAYITVCLSETQGRCCRGSVVVHIGVLLPH